MLRTLSQCTLHYAVVCCCPFSSCQNPSSRVWLQSVAERVVSKPGTGLPPLNHHVTVPARPLQSLCHVTWLVLRRETCAMLSPLSILLSPPVTPSVICVRQASVHFSSSHPLVYFAALVSHCAVRAPPVAKITTTQTKITTVTPLTALSCLLAPTTWATSCWPTCSRRTWRRAPQSRPGTLMLLFLLLFLLFLAGK